MIMKTIEEYDAVVAECRHIYELKMKDYGPSWRIMRPQTVNDQLFIKAKRVREIEQTGVNMVGESVEGEMMAIVNYSVIGLIQLFEGYTDSVDMSRDRAISLYDKFIGDAKALMIRKNHDYGEACSLPASPTSSLPKSTATSRLPPTTTKRFAPKGQTATISI